MATTTKKTTTTAKKPVPVAPKVVAKPTPPPVYVPQSTINSQIPVAGRTGITTTQVAPNKNNTFVPQQDNNPDKKPDKQPDKKTDGPNYPAAGQVIGTRRGSKSGMRVDLIADGKGGYTESADIADDSPQYGDSTVVPGASGSNTNTAVTTPDRSLAEDTFANTFALIFGQSEASQPYVKQLYKLVGSFYKTGSSIDDSLNLALHEAQMNNAIPDFTKRFAGLFALQAKAQSGQAVQVPTIAEFIHAENQMGDVLRSAGMGDLATQDYLGQIIGQGKSVNDVAQAINTSFNAIDTAPQDVKDTLATQFPMLDRTTLAKSLLMGSDGAAEIQKKIDMATTVTAAAKQQVGLTDAQKQLLAQSGLSYNQQLQGLGNVNLEGQRGQTLSDIYGPAVSGFGQDQAFQDQFQGLASAQRAKQQLVQREQGTFNGSSGTLGPSYGTPRSSFNNLTPGQI